MAAQLVVWFFLAAIFIYVSQATGSDFENASNNQTFSKTEKFTPTRVVFSVASTKDQDLDEYVVVKYDKVFVNDGNGFDKSTSVFIAPVSGVYSFHYGILAQGESQVWLKMYKNSEYIISIQCRDDTRYDGSGNSVILLLKKSDNIVLKTGATSRLYGRPDDIYNTFSGFLLYADE